VLEEGPSGYSDLAVPANGSILCLYECGAIAHRCDIGSVLLAHFDPGWIRECAG
jgi:hypothetical protein